MLVTVGAVAAFERSAARHIPGADGYRRFGGPHGKLIAVGRPWGHACQPVRFSVEEHVPDWVYTQIAAVVAATGTSADPHGYGQAVARELFPDVLP